MLVPAAIPPAPNRLIHHAAVVHASAAVAAVIRVIIPAVATRAPTRGIAIRAAAVCSNIATVAILAILALVKILAVAVRMAVEIADAEHTIAVVMAVPRAVLIVMTPTLGALGPTAVVGIRAMGRAVTKADVVCSNRTVTIRAVPESVYFAREMNVAPCNAVIRQPIIFCPIVAGCNRKTLPLPAGSTAELWAMAVIPPTTLTAR
jgi:hypothetical protein